MTEASPKNQTPKRKRGEELGLTPLVFSFDFSQSQSSEDGSHSPRTNITHSFRGLALGGGGGATPDDIDMEDGVRKRQRQDREMEDVTQVIGNGQEEQPEDKRPDHQPPLSLLESPFKINQVRFLDNSDTTTEVPEIDVPLPSTESNLQRAYPSINRLSESKSRSRKRAGTPPLRHGKSQPQEGLSDADDEAEVVDPVRAALTWHEDEITIYDPDDEDDDGTGINGIGFKPTPALAHARVLKRRQQMANYRKREESEARTNRSLRRRGVSYGVSRVEKKTSPPRRVRFMDTDCRPITITTG